jgi:hypothetical protein
VRKETLTILASHLHLSNGWLNNVLVNLQSSLQCGKLIDYMWSLEYPRPPSLEGIPH